MNKSQTPPSSDSPTKPTWDDSFIGLMQVIAERSDDPRTKVGAVIVDEHRTVLSLGYNGAPRGVPNRHVTSAITSEDKYDWVVHADMNAILNAGRIGTSLKDATMYLPWCPCVECAKAIVQSGIREVVILTNRVNSRWMLSCGKAFRMMREAGVTVRLPNRGDDIVVVQLFAEDDESSEAPTFDSSAM